MTDGWMDDARRTTARAAIEDARKRLAVTITRRDDTWHATCGCGTTSTHPTLTAAEHWATRTHRCP